jgi:hypothetical protein
MVDHGPHLILWGRLTMPVAVTLAQAESGEGVALDQSAALRGCRVVEHRARSDGTVPTLCPPASHSETTRSPIAAIGSAPYRSTKCLIRSRLKMLVDSLGRENSGSLVHRSANAASVMLSTPRSIARRVRARSRAAFASPFVCMKEGGMSSAVCGCAK